MFQEKAISQYKTSQKYSPTDHLLERHHNGRFKALMDHYLPNWKHRREALNRLPVRHVDWGY
ncbi:MAG: M48 family metallopeptidase [Lewinellaceae bacterium]|nr:M48 family metallopeptidase [Phaeodactylibacter sp.]MCB9037769.1 M48 family metallopeptidase [Lewinellaceae bacterium]